MTKANGTYYVDFEDGEVKKWWPRRHLTFVSRGTPQARRVQQEQEQEQ